MFFSTVADLFSSLEQVNGEDGLRVANVSLQDFRDIDREREARGRKVRFTYLAEPRQLLNTVPTGPHEALPGHLETWFLVEVGRMGLSHSWRRTGATQFPVPVAAGTPSLTGSSDSSGEANSGGILVLFEASGILQDIPLNQVLEENIYRSFLGKDGDCSDRSENTDVQTELSFLRGWQSTLNMIPGIVTAVPYGYLIDRHGRKLDLILNTVGIFLAQIPCTRGKQKPHQTKTRQRRILHTHLDQRRPGQL
ncbi:hypothetical protein Sste5346_005746 [Sporothrix stenoceras]|uniref:Uncharacterized protein n=1 Tax=Sporothrix stenoceras TaxID=5173 RepID=A0ABR3Z3A9_9PEZI